MTTPSNTQEHTNANFLSWLPLPTHHNETLHVSSVDPFLDSQLPTSDCSHHQKTNTHRSRTGSGLRVCTSGWPTSVHNSLQPYYVCCSELSTNQECILWEAWVFIPRLLYNRSQRNCIQSTLKLFRRNGYSYTTYAIWIQNHSLYVCFHSRLQRFAKWHTASMQTVDKCYSKWLDRVNIKLVQVISATREKRTLLEWLAPLQNWRLRNHTLSVTNLSFHKSFQRFGNFYTIISILLALLFYLITKSSKDN